MSFRKTRSQKNRQLANSGGRRSECEDIANLNSFLHGKYVEEERSFGSGSTNTSPSQLSPLAQSLLNAMENGHMTNSGGGPSMTGSGANPVIIPPSSPRSLAANSINMVCTKATSLTFQSKSGSNTRRERERASPRKRTSQDETTFKSARKERSVTSPEQSNDKLIHAASSEDSKRKKGLISPEKRSRRKSAYDPSCSAFTHDSQQEQKTDRFEGSSLRVERG